MERDLNDKKIFGEAFQSALDVLHVSGYYISSRALREDFHGDIMDLLFPEAKKTDGEQADGVILSTPEATNG